MTDQAKPLAAVTGASSGIGLELARQFAQHGFDLIVAAEEDDIQRAAAELRVEGVGVSALRADLASPAGVESLVNAIRQSGRVLDALAANAGVGVNGRFWETDLDAHRNLIDLNITSVVHLVHEVLPSMVDRGEGRVLITSSIAGQMPGPYQSTYNASKAFLTSFASAIRHELKGTGVTVTALMPGPTETEFFERAGMEDTRLGQASKDDPADVARDGYEALMAGRDHVVAGSAKNRAQVAAAKVLPDKVVAAAHAPMTEPGKGT
jgi:short-subunit dehydrogenase